MDQTNTPAQRVRGQLQQFLTLCLALLILAAGWADVWTGAPWWRALGAEPQMWWHLFPLMLMAGVILLRVHRPVLALSLGMGVVLLDLGIGLNIGILLCLTDLVYSLGLRAGTRAVRTAEKGFIAVVVLACVAVAVTGGGASSTLNVALLGGGILLVPLWWASEVRRGYPLWQENDMRQRLEAERHASLLREQERKRRAAVEEERRRMARELHDDVSSQVSAIALTSGAVLNSEPDDSRDRQALRTIRSISVEALDQLREMMQLLRGEQNLGTGDNLTWEDMIARARRQGTTVDVDGEVPADVNPELRHVVLRVLQESLANALKHGDGIAHVVVEARRRVLRLRITSGLGRVTETGTASGTGLTEGQKPLGSETPAPGTGIGLAAMRERVQRIRGTFRAGPEDSRWVVSVALPLKEITHD